MSGYHIGCDFSPDGSIIASGSADGQIYFYDHHTSHMVRTLQAHSMPCMDVAFHPTLPNCVLLVVGGRDKSKFGSNSLVLECINCTITINFQDSRQNFSKYR